MLGLLAGLGELLTNVLNWIFSKIIENIVVPIIKVLLQVVISVIQYFGSALFYELSVFILKLIDFVEVLFRALAGLGSNNGNMGAGFSLNGKSGDLLLQFITHKDVLDVFFACAIVGIFLLMITTIFQIVKVEYTTEGANNSKTTILNKSFKALVNMLMVPIMVVLGVFIGNQVLELIDTATGGGENARISGCLWVTSASTAMLKEKGTLATALEKVGVDFDDGTNAGELIGAGVSLAITEGFTVGLREIFPSDKKSLMESVTLGDPTNRDFVEQCFMSGGLKYSNLNDVVEYYNPFEVNYLVLIFAGCLILKALFNCCFGMIDRLYRCTALFIVMPLAVGMAPVKDNLGSWRSSFISKALSAYGIIISMNIFFTIINVMLQIDITFTGDFKALPFPNSFMVGLVKSLMVIVGCQMITKLAGDMGSYFGGGNAEADGAGLAKEATAGLQKAVAVGGGIAMGAGALALKAGKGIANGVGGIADRINSGHKLNKAEQDKNDANRFLNTQMKANGISDDQLNAYADKAQQVSEQDNIINSSRQTINDSFERENNANKIINDPNASRSDIAKAKEELSNARKDRTTAQSNMANAEDKKSELRKDMAAMNMKRDKNGKVIRGESNGLADAYEMKKDADKAQTHFENVSAENEKKKAERQKAKVDRKAKVHMASEAVRKMAGDTINNTFGMGAAWQAIAPGALKKVPEQYKKAYNDANAVSPEGKQMLDNEAKLKADKAEAAYNKRNKGWIESRKSTSSQMISTMMVQKVEIANQDLNKQLDRLALAFNKAKASGDEDGAKYYINQMRALNSNIVAPANGGKFDLNNKSEYQVKLDGMADFKKALADAIKRNAKASELESMLQDQLKKWGQEGNAKLLSELHKALEEIKNTVGK